MKKIIITIVCLISLLVGTMGVYAQEDKDDARVGLIDCETLPEQTKEWLFERGITINDSSVLEAISIKDVKETEYATGLCVTTRIDNQIIKQTLMLMNDNGTPIDLSVERLSRATGSATYIDDIGGYFGVTGYAVYDVYYDSNSTSYIHPTAAYFMYTKRKTCTVSTMTVAYSCSGEKYTYPGFVDTGNTVTHTITVSKSSPSPNTVYSNYSNPFSSSYCIYIAGAWGGQVIRFSYTVNGSSNTYYISI